MKHRIQHPEYRIQPGGVWVSPQRRGGAERGQNPIAAKERMERRAKRAKRSLEPIWGRAEAVRSGKRREGGDESGRFFPPFPGISGHFPPFPTFSHFIFYYGTTMRRICRMGRMNTILYDGIRYDPPPCPLPRAGTRGRGRCLLDGVTQGVALRLALPWATYRSPLRGCNVPHQAELGTKMGKFTAEIQC